MKVVYASDLHGDLDRYRALMALANAEDAAALILGGDIFPGGSVARVDLAFATGPFAEIAAKGGLPIHLIAGNSDWPAAIHQAERFRYVHGLSLEPLTLGGVVLQGYPIVPPTKFRRKDFERRDRSSDAIVPDGEVFISDPQGLVFEVEPDYLQKRPSIEEEFIPTGGHAAIWVTHTPPHGGLLDVTRAGVHAGSRALRAAIEQAQPILTLHGHIHEAPQMSGGWAELIGHTVCVNAGASAGLSAVVFDTEDPMETLRHTEYGRLVH
ncbi:MAG: metallophosphoesterase family protein [Bacillota bacterium]